MRAALAALALTFLSALPLPAACIGTNLMVLPLADPVRHLHRRP